MPFEVGGTECGGGAWLPARPTGRRAWLLSGSACGNEPRAAEVPEWQPGRLPHKGPHAAAVPLLTLLDSRLPDVGTIPVANIVKGGSAREASPKRREPQKSATRVLTTERR
jgi:hypothetical protein